MYHFMEENRLIDFKQEMAITMYPHQVKPFLKFFIKYMNKNVHEISENQQKRMCSTLTFLQNLIENGKKKSRSKKKSNPNSSSNTSYFCPGTRKYDFDLVKNIQGPLQGPKKLEFIESIKNLLEEFLSSEVLTKSDRKYWTLSFCNINCRIPRNLVLNWIISSKYMNEIK